ncbi:translocation/assembly module TamB domain-containing protein [Lutibacter sp.]|uniref:translocation/assembly module TamB domain-containing protein n=1 Tax=Lutibacter sp. TaxID=1925666 RepID=UPI003569C6B0
MATDYLRTEFNVDINVEKVDLSFLGRVDLNDVLVKDHHADTLIYVHNLTTSVLSYRDLMNLKFNFGQISLEEFILNMKTYKGEEDDAFTIFINKFDSETVTDEPSGFLLTARRLKLVDGYVELVDENKENNKPLFFKEIIGTAKNFKIDGPNVFADISKFHFIENHQVEVQSLSTNFSYSKTAMSFLNTQLETEKSSISADIKFTYVRADFSDFNNKVMLNADVKKADVSMLDLKKFYDELGTNDVLHFSTKISGYLNDFRLKNLEMNSDKQASIIGNLNFINSFNNENGFSLAADLTKLTSNYDHLKSLLPNILGEKLPSSFQKFGQFTVSGFAYITEDLINTDIKMQTDIGSLITDLELTNIGNIDNASYFGHIKIIDFELGKILNDSIIGQLSMEANIDGKGFTLEKMNTSVKGLISELQFKDYNYTSINLNGVVKNKHFDGEMEVNDDNIKLNFKGLADFSKKRYTFNFKTVVDYLDLNTLNLFKRDSISKIKGDIEIKVKGNTLDDLAGTIDFKNSLYINQKDSYFFKDFNITSSFEDSVRTVTVNSTEIIDGYLKGKFKFGELVKLTKNSIGSIYSNYKPFIVTPGQELNFKFKIYNKIVEVFYPEVTLSANTFIAGNLNSDDNLFRLNVKSPEITAFKNSIDSLNLQIDTKNPLFNTQLSVAKINTKQYNISKLQLVNITLSDTLYFRTEFFGGDNNTENYNLAFYHTFNKENKSVFGLQQSNFTFKDTKWIINPEDNFDNKLVYDDKTKTYDISPFLITSKKQKIEFFGQIRDTISKDLTFKFEKVNLATVTPEIDSLKLNGVLNGSLNYKQLNDVIKPTGNFSIADFKVNNSYQGNLKVAIEGKNSIRNYGVNISLERDNSINLSAVGDLDFTPKNPTIDVEVEFQEFKLDAFSPLGKDVFSNIRGFAYGNVHLTGLLNNPAMEGELFLDQAGLYFPYLNVDYDFEGTSVISLKNQTFNLEDVQIKDKAFSTRGKLTGSISHVNFEKWRLNLNVNTKNLLVLNTIEKENSVYYGTGFLEGYASIFGPTDKLVIDVVGRTKRGTYLTIPISDVKTVESSQLIRFINKSNPEENEETRRAFISEKLKGLTLNFNIDVTKDAVVEMVLDKATGSFLKGSGTGNMQISLDTKDKFEMYGDFIVDNGVYNFKYGGFINKPFIVKRGGSISWSGNPLTADINIEAVYRVSANPRSLLENISSSRKIPIDLVTRFSGELFNTQREFDIEIPNASSTVASELAFKLNNDNLNSKTVQFISLLISGSFYNESDLSVNSNTALYGTGFDILSNAFDNIFNQGNNRFKLRPEYTVGERGNVDNLNIEDQLAIGLDYQLNERIIINGKVGVPMGTGSQTNIIGEVNVEFLLNEEGSLRSSVFNRQNEIQYSQEEEGYTQGIGLSYQIDFDNGKELLRKLGLRIKKQNDSINGLKPLDTIEMIDKLLKFKNKNKKDE